MSVVRRFATRILLSILFAGSTNSRRWRRSDTAGGLRRTESTFSPSLERHDKSTNVLLRKLQAGRKQDRSPLDRPPLTQFRLGENSILKKARRRSSAIA